MKYSSVQSMAEAYDARGARISAKIDKHMNGKVVTPEGVKRIGERLLAGSDVFDDEVPPITAYTDDDARTTAVNGRHAMKPEGTLTATRTPAGDITPIVFATLWYATMTGVVQHDELVK